MGESVLTFLGFLGDIPRPHPGQYNGIMSMWSHRFCSLSAVPQTLARERTSIFAFTRLMPNLCSVLCYLNSQNPRRPLSSITTSKQRSIATWNLSKYFGDQEILSHGSYLQLSTPMIQAAFLASLVTSFALLVNIRKFIRHD